MLTRRKGGKLLLNSRVSLNISSGDVSAAELAHYAALQINISIPVFYGKVSQQCRRRGLNAWAFHRSVRGWDLLPMGVRGHEANKPTENSSKDEM